MAKAELETGTPGLRMWLSLSLSGGMSCGRHRCRSRRSARFIRRFSDSWRSVNAIMRQLRSRSPACTLNANTVGTHRPWRFGPGCAGSFALRETGRNRIGLDDQRGVKANELRRQRISSLPALSEGRGLLMQVTDGDVHVLELQVLVTFTNCVRGSD